MTDDRRHDIRREEDDDADPVRLIQRVQFNVERRHTENVQRFDEIEGTVKELSAKLDTHIQETITTKSMVAELHECIDRNASMLDEKIGQLHKTIADMKDNFLPILIKDAAIKTWTLAQICRKTAVWLAPIIGTALLTCSVILWWLGKAPFPHG